MDSQCNVKVEMCPTKIDFVVAMLVMVESDLTYRK